MRKMLSAAACITIGLTTSTAAQDGSLIISSSSTVDRHLRSTASKATFRSGTDLVALTVTVTDGARAQVPGLSGTDFVVFDEGIEQSLSFFAAMDVPLDLTLLVDVSASMNDKMHFVRTAAGGLIRSLRPGDRAALVVFDRAMQIELPLTGELGQVQAAIGRLAAGGGTALYNAMYAALTASLREPRPSEIRRRAMVVISDGADTQSLVSFDDVLDLARRTSLMLYTVAIKDGPRADQPRLSEYVPSDYELRRLAAETGARGFVVRDAREMTAICSGIADELRNQYALAYVPGGFTSDDGTWRRVSVRIVGRTGLTPRTRAGYYAASLRAAERPAESLALR